jgi:hypothetical protein
MNYSIIEIRNFIAENFILFTICAMGLLMYLHIYPYAFPGLASRISLVFFFYISSLIILYFSQIIFYFLKIIDNIIAACSSMLFGDKLELVLRNVRIQYTDYSQYTKDELTILGINKAFQILFISFILVLLIQELNLSMIEWIKMDNFLILLIIFGIVALFNNDEKRIHKIKPVCLTQIDHIFIGIAGALGTVSVWYQIQGRGSISYIIALFSGIFIITISTSIIEKDALSTDK